GPLGGATVPSLVEVELLVLVVLVVLRVVVVVVVAGGMDQVVEVSVVSACGAGSYPGVSPGSATLESSPLLVNAIVLTSPVIAMIATTITTAMIGPVDDLGGVFAGPPYVGAGCRNPGGGCVGGWPPCGGRIGRCGFPALWAAPGCRWARCGSGCATGGGNGPCGAGCPELCGGSGGCVMTPQSFARRAPGTRCVRYRCRGDTMICRTILFRDRGMGDAYRRPRNGHALNRPVRGRAGCCARSRARCRRHGRCRARGSAARGRSERVRRIDDGSIRVDVAIDE